MRNRTVSIDGVSALPLISMLLWIAASSTANAQPPTPTLVDPRLAVRTVIGGLTSPISMAFLGEDEFLVLEKVTGQVKHVVDGEVEGVALDLAVNFNSERGLLGIALHPDFPEDPGVYLFWTCRTTTPPDSDPFQPEEQECPDVPVPGDDSGLVDEVPVLGNRVDRFLWDEEEGTLTFDHNLIKLRAFQADGGPDPAGQGDEGQPARGNHDGGVLRFGPDGRLYVFYGDQGRRGQLQNLPCGPTGECPTIEPDDQIPAGGPQPDDEHMSGVILRLEDDGSTPTDNPFFAHGATVPGEAGANIQKIFAYGLRNSFGMAFDPESGKLWEQENGDDSFTELNLVEPGMNGGWVQIMGPIARLGQYKMIETRPDSDPNLGTLYFGLQQLRWPPTNIADTAADARTRLFMLPGAHYSDPEFSWKFEVSPAGIVFLDSRALGPQYQGDLFLGSARDFLLEGQLFRLNLTGNRRKIAAASPALEDRVADNDFKFDIKESEPLLFGEKFGVATDLLTAPNGNLWVVSISHGIIYEVFRQ